MGWDRLGQHCPQPGTGSTRAPHPCPSSTDLFRLWISSRVKSKMLARWWLVLQAEVKSLCPKNKLTPHCLAQAPHTPALPPWARGHRSPSPGPGL